MQSTEESWSKTILAVSEILIFSKVLTRAWRTKTPNNQKHKYHHTQTHKHRKTDATTPKYKKLYSHTQTAEH